MRYIAELANSRRVENSAYYTDPKIVDSIVDRLPSLKLDTIRVLEPAAGTGNFLIPLINKISSLYKNVALTVNDIDADSLKVAKLFIRKASIPVNVKIKYTCSDFMSPLSWIGESFDLVIGNPPFKRLSKQAASEYGDGRITNLAGQFLSLALKISSNVAMVMPKNFLSTCDFKSVRDEISHLNVQSIFDFGERGFKGVLIETIALIVSSVSIPGKTTIISWVNKTERVVNQAYIVDNDFPNWLVYRDEFFDKISQKLKFGVFTAFRDRQIVNRLLHVSGDIRVLKSRNISRDGTKILNISGYDSYINEKDAKGFTVYKYLDSDNVYLAPNMTYYPRLAIKPKHTLVNGSLAILKPQEGVVVTDADIRYIGSLEFQKFYSIARNCATRSLNIDSQSVYWYAVQNK